MFPAAHYRAGGTEATGLTTYDLPYYAANARALVERGHLGCYPNAFDPDANAPAIYCHWLISILAILIGPLAMDPGLALLAIQLVGGWAAARVMFAIVETLAPGRNVVPLFLSTMWGGGLLVLGKLATNALNGYPWDLNPLTFDPGQGLWGLNFGRTLILPTEAVYHALMLGLWLGLLRRQWNLAALMLWLIATTHPFTGAQAIAITGAWIGLSWFTESSRPPLGFVASVAVTAIAFAGYYGFYLPSFPQHRALENVWTLHWTLTLPMMLLAWQPAAMLALAGVGRAGWSSRTRFLATAACVSFLLANHQWFMTPRQPIHFTRGYIWTPLWLMGLPALTALLDRLRNLSIAPKVVTVSLLGVLLVSDNAAFLAINWLHPKAHGYFLTDDERRAFRELASQTNPGILLTDDERLGYLAAAYTPARPWFGHKYNTPQFEARKERVERFIAGEEDPDLLMQGDLWLTESPSVAERLQTAGWRPVADYGALKLLRRSFESHDPMTKIRLKTTL
jgi:hypothetical protein